MTSAQPTNHSSGFLPFIIRFGAISLALSGLLFVLYPAVRPWHDESTVGGALSSMSSNAWVAAHLFAILALILMPLGMLGLCALVAGSRGLRLTFAATVVMWIGAGLTLPYYGRGGWSTGRHLDLAYGDSAAVPLAIGLVLLIPQFYLPAWARIAHGVLVAIGLLWLAWVLWTKKADLIASRLGTDGPAAPPSDDQPSKRISARS
jgi:hypothetical protein